MERLILVAALFALAAVAAALVRRRPVAEPATPPGLPTHLERSDFDRPEAPWLVVLFSSTTCESCAALMPKIAPLESADVVVQEVEWSRHRDLHRRYGIDAVPYVAVADAEGTVKASFLGSFTATDLWATVAEVRGTPG